MQRVVSFVMFSHLFNINPNKKVMLTLKSWHQEKSVKDNSHVQELTTVQHLATWLLLTPSFLNATVFLQVVKKDLLHLNMTFRNLSQKPFDIGSFPTCDNFSLPLTLLHYSTQIHRLWRVLCEKLRGLKIFPLVNQYNVTLLSYCYIRSRFHTGLCTCLLVCVCVDVLQ